MARVRYVCGYRHLCHPLRSNKHAHNNTQSRIVLIRNIVDFARILFTHSSLDHMKSNNKFCRKRHMTVIRINAYTTSLKWTFHTELNLASNQNCHLFSDMFRLRWFEDSKEIRNLLIVNIWWLHDENILCNDIVCRTIWTLAAKNVRQECYNLRK